MKNQEAKKLLRRYLFGSITRDQKQKVDQWYRSFESEKPIVLPESEFEEIKEDIWDRISPGISGSTSKLFLKNVSFWSRIAALLIIAAGVSLLVFKNKPTKTPKPDLFTSVITKAGEMKKVILSDSSVLTLNGGTTIHINSDFAKTREVEIIDGEVFFDVHRDPARPFLIRSGKVITKVLGTAFNISAYTELSKMSVAVLRGTVQVSSSTSKSILKKEQMLTYLKQSGTSSVGRVPAKLFSWIEGSLFLDDVSFADMVVLMKKNFKVDVAMKQKSIAKTRYTAILPTTMAPVKAVEVIAAIHNLKIKRLGDSFLLFR